MGCIKRPLNPPLNGPQNGPMNGPRRTDTPLDGCSSINTHSMYNASYKKALVFAKKNGKPEKKVVRDRVNDSPTTSLILPIAAVLPFFSFS